MSWKVSAVLIECKMPGACRENGAVICAGHNLDVSLSELSDYIRDQLLLHINPLYIGKIKAGKHCQYILLQDYHLSTILRKTEDREIKQSW